MNEKLKKFEECESLTCLHCLLNQNVVLDDYCLLSTDTRHDTGIRHGYVDTPVKF
jgi:hypothetical protein